MQHILNYELLEEGMQRIIKLVPKFDSVPDVEKVTLELFSTLSRYIKERGTNDDYACGEDMFDSLHSRVLKLYTEYKDPIWRLRFKHAESITKDDAYDYIYNISRDETRSASLLTLVLINYVVFHALPSMHPVNIVEPFVKYLESLD